MFSVSTAKNLTLMIPTENRRMRSSDHCDGRKCLQSLSGLSKDNEPYRAREGGGACHCLAGLLCSLISPNL